MRGRNEKGGELGGVGYKTLRYNDTNKGLKWSLRDTYLRRLLLISVRRYRTQNRSCIQLSSLSRFAFNCDYPNPKRKRCHSLL
jgi:hypothetical protein